jgi:hypothetical protein
MKLEQKIDNLLGKRYDFITIDNPTDMNALDFIQDLHHSIHRNMSYRQILGILHMIDLYERTGDKNIPVSAESHIGRTLAKHLSLKKMSYVFSGEIHWKSLNMPQED